MWEKEVTHENLARKPDGKRQLWGLRHRRVYDEIDLEEVRLWRCAMH
jgi:hypothetical protein